VGTDTDREITEWEHPALGSRRASAASSPAVNVRPTRGNAPGSSATVHKEEIIQRYPILTPPVPPQSPGRRSLLIEWPDKPRVPELKLCWETLMDEIRRQSQADIDFNEHRKSLKQIEGSSRDSASSTTARPFSNVGGGSAADVNATKSTIAPITEMRADATTAKPARPATATAAQIALELEQQRWGCGQTRSAPPNAPKVASPLRPKKKSSAKDKENPSAGQRKAVTAKSVQRYSLLGANGLNADPHSASQDVIAESNML
jgi:hypothetical protein